jgi:hypothetical protein
MARHQLPRGLRASDYCHGSTTSRGHQRHGGNSTTGTNTTRATPRRLRASDYCHGSTTSRGHQCHGGNATRPGHQRHEGTNATGAQGHGLLPWEHTVARAPTPRGHRATGYCHEGTNTTGATPRGHQRHEGTNATRAPTPRGHQRHGGTNATGAPTPRGHGPHSTCEASRQRPACLLPRQPWRITMASTASDGHTYNPVLANRRFSIAILEWKFSSSNEDNQTPDTYVYSATWASSDCAWWRRSSTWM